MIRFRSPISLAREEFVHAHEQCRPLRRSPFTPLAGLPATPREDNLSLFQDSVLSSPRVIPPVRDSSHFLRRHRYLADFSVGTLPARGFTTCSLFWTTTHTRIDYPERQPIRGSRNPRSLPMSPSIWGRASIDLASKVTPACKLIWGRERLTFHLGHTSGPSAVSTRRSLTPRSRCALRF